MDRKIRTRLVDFADRLKGPLGAVPLDRAIRGDLELFSTLRSSGASWVQIANALASAGARRPDGGAISADHIRSAVSRQLKRAAAIAAAPDAPRVTVIQPARKSVPQSDRNPSNPQKTSSAPAATRPSTTSTKPDPKKPTSQQNASILEKLARTRQLRET